MNELIKIERREGRETVSARGLHEFLEVGKDFSTWIKDRIEKYEFISGQDFTTISGKSTGGRPTLDYFITFDMAKELSMVENNERGRQARQYFIEMEKRAKAMTSAIPQSFAEALRLAADQQEAIERMAPKEIAFDKFMSAENYQQIGDVAKVLGFGRNTFFGMLRDDKILMKTNTPYQEYMQYFKLIEKPVNICGHIENKLVVTVNASGIDYLTKRYGVK